MIIITLILFVSALYTKDLTHDILLEAGVFLISVKIIIMTYKNGSDMEYFGKQLEEIKSLLKKTVVNKNIILLFMKVEALSLLTNHSFFKLTLPVCFAKSVDVACV